MSTNAKLSYIRAGMTAREFIISIGGYRLVAQQLGKQPTTVHTQMQKGQLPASWYFALCRLARLNGVDVPSRALFSFIEVSVGSEDGRDGGDCTGNEVAA